MAERALRGMKIGAYSLESEEGVAFAPRVRHEYQCPEGHTTLVPFADDAEIPQVWDCKCGEQAFLVGGQVPEPEKPAKPTRTHWDMLLERRSIEELEALLEERLALLRSGEMRRRSA
ncbi:RNA polymerase-binding protein RbpA [Buchananella hordeovulneris]|uniref:RNA polymerase-binding protein RbpA n=1 Tax=Buchananella hordeovulneris TaxID=52770 RepID=A0A1Q5PXS7_9ACTO|nr:RNA polymerase-binding protein RbpA [Buchananella hordeovulneris]MDO5079679.1 RNA polymerase-binding protein RbpA [Buchananella hordeovulneris]OKL52411.1 electron transporter [Buchananella hordeovulneris]RRD45401.1 RNA polymerase-binding protein RbpA [Buchananella hordeovulneris]RRD53840.1 RNA polymerase-binding protein RbpA [Buchananella hordeovulneris]